MVPEVFQSTWRPKSSQCNCCMFSTASASRPAAKTIKTIPSTRKNLRMLSFAPSLNMANATLSATANPRAAPSKRRFPCTGVAACRSLAKTIASVKTIVSKPSRPTAWKASSPNPHRFPFDSARSLRCCNSRARTFACNCIQKVIYVRTTAARRYVAVSK